MPTRRAAETAAVVGRGEAIWILGTRAAAHDERHGDANQAYEIPHGHGGVGPSGRPRVQGRGRLENATMHKTGVELVYSGFETWFGAWGPQKTNLKSSFLAPGERYDHVWCTGGRGTCCRR